MRENLAQSRISVHLIGARYGIIPEGAEESTVALQNRWASEQSLKTGLPRLVWLPQKVETCEPRQQKFITLLREDRDCQRGAEIVGGILGSLKVVFLDRLKPKPTSKITAEAHEKQRPPHIYLICDLRDEEEVRELEDYLFGKGLEVSIPDFEAEEVGFAESHRESLKESDAILIYYGTSRRSWVEANLRDLMKAPGFGREKPFTSKGVYITPSEDARKLRFKTHLADIIRPETKLDPAALEPFIQDVLSAVNPSS